MGILTPDELAQPMGASNNKRERIIAALLDTVMRTTDLENVYNDSTGESFSWPEVYQELNKNVD